MKFLYLLVFFFSGAYVADAHVPIFDEQTSLRDVTIIEDPTLSQVFYGELNDFPHTYQITVTRPTHLFTEILVPDIDSSVNNISGIIIKLPKERGRVTEIASLLAKDSSWHTEYEPFGGDTYRHGPQFEGELEAGTYRIEVHTPKNREKYALVVGQREEMTIGYFTLLGRLVDVKRFFEKSPVRIIESPFVYVPLGVVLTLLAVILTIRKRRAREAGLSQDGPPQREEGAILEETKIKQE